MSFCCDLIRLSDDDDHRQGVDIGRWFVPWDVLADVVVQSQGFIQITEIPFLPLAAANQCLPPGQC